MSDSSAHTAELTEFEPTGLDRKKLMMWLFLASDCMFFGTLISTHLIYRKIYPDIGVQPESVFDLELTTFSSFILLMSSLLMALAVSAMHKADLRGFRKYCAGTIAFGLIFLGCQVYEFQHFVHSYDFTLGSGTFGSTFYLMTGTHGIHVAIGVLWLLSMLIYSYTGKMGHGHAIDVEVAGLYWHFVDIVWIVIFTAVYLLEFV